MSSYNEPRRNKNLGFFLYANSHGSDCASAQSVNDFLLFTPKLAKKQALLLATDPGGFQKNEYFWGYEDFVDIFWGHNKLDYIKGSFLCILGSFLTSPPIPLDGDSATLMAI